MLLTKYFMFAQRIISQQNLVLPTKKVEETRSVVKRLQQQTNSWLLGIGAERVEKKKTFCRLKGVRREERIKDIKRGQNGSKQPSKHSIAAFLASKKHLIVHGWLGNLFDT